VRRPALGRTILEPPGLRTTRLDRVGAAVDGGDVGIAGARCRLGTAICGKWAAGSDRSGIVAGSGRASISERIAPAIGIAYGTANDSAHTRANQNRMRRVPRLLMPNVPVLKPGALATAGVSLATSIHPH
jgi:hypothetical protein